MNKELDKQFEESLNRNLKTAEALGSIKVINAIQTVFRQPNGDIHITYDEWTNFMIPYTEVPK